MPPRFAIDHLVVAAPSLAAGTAHLADALGVAIPPGGAHPLMATHNHLMRLGEDEFLEVIAVDPAARPARPRWFALDRHGDAAPRLSTFVLRTDDLDAALPLLPEGAGEPVTVSRGALTWRIVVPADGAMPYGGAFPAVIEWPRGALPGAGMAGRGCALTRLTIEHPQAEALARWLRPLLADERLTVSAASHVRLSAEIETPAGLRRL